MSEPITPPGLALQWLEARAGAEAASLFLQMPLLRLQAPKGNKQPVLVLPGFMADDQSTFILRRFLTSLDYQVSGWGLGRNTGRMMDRVPAIMDQVRALASEHKQPVHLVGWSRGGTLAREVARDLGQQQDDLVRQIITMGTPVRGGPAATSISWLAARQTGMTVEQMNALVEERSRTPITVPITALYSKTDGVVAWRASIDERSPDVQHHEVEGSHSGLGFNAQVYRLLARHLAKPR